MKITLLKSTLTLALAATLVGPSVWSTASHACGTDTYISSICIMSWPRSASFGGGAYQAAAGQTLTVSQYQALFSLIGNTYGGTYPSTFQLPDLRGRVIVGAGQGPGLPTYNYGDKGGNPTVTLTLAQLPVHTHVLGTGVTATTGIGTLAATTTIGTLAATTTMGTLAASTTLSGLTATLKAGSGTAATQDATNNALASVSGGRTLIYNSVAPTVAMNSASIALSGNPTTTLTGSPSTALAGTPATTLSGGPSVTVGGQTNATGSGAAVPTMPPYLALSYYIAVSGLYPTMD